MNLAKLMDRMPPAAMPSQRADIEAVALVEGSYWITDELAVREICLHADPFAVRMKDGRIWDAVAGWRDEYLPPEEGPEADNAIEPFIISHRVRENGMGGLLAVALSERTVGDVLVTRDKSKGLVLEGLNPDRYYDHQAACFVANKIKDVELTDD
jgi:hypothetical protein